MAELLPLKCVINFGLNNILFIEIHNALKKIISQID